MQEESLKQPSDEVNKIMEDIRRSQENSLCGTLYDGDVAYRRSLRATDKVSVNARNKRKKKAKQAKASRRKNRK